MDSLSSINPVEVAGKRISLATMLKSLHRRGLLRSLLAESAVEQCAVEQARQAGISIADAELQQAVNRFRQRHCLASADDTQRWLAEQGWSLEDLEDQIEREMLIDRFKDHLCAREDANHFAANQQAFDQARLHMILVAEEGLARELLSQAVAEERKFAELAREHSLHPSCARGGQMGWARRGELPVDVADKVFAAAPGENLGPFPAPKGVALFHVEELRPAELNDETRRLIRQQLYDAWVNEQLTTLRVDLSWLKEESASDGARTKE